MKDSKGDKPKSKSIKKSTLSSNITTSITYPREWESVIQKRLTPKIPNRLEFIRYCILNTIKEDHYNDFSLMLKSLTRQEGSLKRLNTKIDMLFELFSFFTRYFCIYTDEIPEDKAASALSQGKARHERFLESFETYLGSDGKRLLSRFMSDFLEEKSDGGD